MFMFLMRLYIHFVGSFCHKEWQNLVSILWLVIKFIGDGAYTLFSVPKGHFRWTLLTNSCDVILNTGFFVVFSLKLKWNVAVETPLKLQSFGGFFWWNSAWLRIQNMIFFRCILMHLDKCSILPDTYYKTS